MKKLFSLVLAALFSISSLAATTVPVQLINPIGSSSGQAAVSTGPSSAPTWGGVGLNGIAAISSNTIIANVTGSSASPTAFAMPSCSTTSSILQYTSNIGFTCSATIWASPPAIGGTTSNSGKFTTLQTTSTYTPSTTAGIVGTTLADNANAGSIGEYQSSSSGAISLTSATTANIVSLSLTAGDWDIQGVVNVIPSGGILTSTTSGITTTSATLAGLGTWSTVSPTGNAAVGFNDAIPTPTVRVNVSSTTTVYLVTNASFSAGTCTGTGFIRARRIR